MTQPLRWSRHEDLAIRKTPTVGRSAYLDHMTFEADCGGMFDEIFGPIIGLKEEWLAQGATPGELDFSAFRYRCAARGWLGVSTGRFGLPDEQFIEETDEHVLTRDGLGRTMKLCKGSASLPLPLDWPVETMDDWQALKPHYTFREDRLGDGWQRTAAEHLQAERAITVSIPGGFDEPRQLMGEERACIAYYEQPEMMHDMLATFTETALAVLERVTAEVPVDILFVHEDMAGKSGPLAGPAQIREFIGPYYRKVWELCQDRGVRLFDQDSDGNMTPVIDAFLDAGVNCMHPIEPAAGMDVVALREKYGRRLATYGGIDKHVLRSTKEDIDAELARKVPAMLASGGCVLALDHRIPNGTPLENYRYYVRRMWEYLDAHQQGASAQASS